MADLLPLFVNLAGRRVLVVGGGPVAASKLAQLLAAGAQVRLVAPQICAEIENADATRVLLERRTFEPADLDDVWLVVAAATPEVNRAVAAAAESRRVLVNAVDDPQNASAFLGGVIRRDGMTLAISSNGDAPGLTSLLRQALDALLPSELDEWVREARRQRAEWRKAGVPMGARRPLLLEALNWMYEREVRLKPDATPEARSLKPEARSLKPGFVSLVGAGPGDPGLLTRTAVARLRSADLVLYDALIDDRVLRIARHAQRFFVGKRAGKHALAQREIHAVMIRAARRGRRVVRLKGGDPFVFGRGGEEAQALADAGVPFEVVPGVTSASAASTLAGIPLTHRGIASAFLVVSGHDVERFAAAVQGVAPEGTTIVVLMGMANRAALAAALQARGWSPSTPVAVVSEASMPSAHAWRGEIGDLTTPDLKVGPTIAGDTGVDGDGPATLIIGDVAALKLGSAASESARTLDRSRGLAPRMRRDSHG